MASRFRQFDWSSTSIGPPAYWPESWRNVVALMLDSRFPAYVGLGNDLCFFYNDAYIPLGGPARHPSSIGQPVALVWKDIWEDVIRPRFLHTLRTGEPTGGEDFLFLLERSGRLEETYISFSYTPLRDEHGRPNGIFCPSYETTGRVIAQRQLKCLRGLAACSSFAETPERVCKSAAKILEASPRDLPFTLIYLADVSAGTLQLAACSGLDPMPPSVPEFVDLARPRADPWKVAKVAREGELAVVELSIVELAGIHAGDAFGIEPGPNQAVVLPIRGGEHLAGILVAGANPLRPLAESQAFHTLIAGHLETAIANARAQQHLHQRAQELAAELNRLRATERKERAIAEDANRSKDEFLAMLAHELCSPVTAMLGWVETLRGKTLDPAVAHALHMIEHSLNSQRRLIDDLLDLSRIVTDRFHVELEYVASLQPLVATVVASLQPQALAKGVVLDVSMEPDVGPVEADSHRLQQVIWNLLTNAIAFTPAGGRIEVRGARSDDCITLTVSDSGQGISPEALQHIFERFWQERGATARQHSQGLGLTIAQRIVALHGGHITAASEGMGRGATFTVSLPVSRLVDVRPKLDQTAATTAQRALQSAARQTQAGLRVLLVEDHDGIAKAFERVLTREGYIVIRAGAIEEAVHAVGQQEVDVLVCDLTLADGSGLDLLRRIRPRLRKSLAGAALPAIATSGGDRDGDVAACLTAGFALHIPKPFDGPTLIEAIRSITQRVTPVEMLASPTGR